MRASNWQEPADERRQSPRYRLRMARSMMEWREGNEAVTCHAEVLNISGEGAAVLVYRSPPLNERVQLRLECRAAAAEPMEARSLAVTDDPSGRKLVRLRFARWHSLDDIIESHLERRLWQRFPVSDTHAKLTWYDGESEKTARGEVRNIGGGGAAVIVDTNLPVDRPIWIEMEGDGDTLDPIESRLVATSLDPSGVTIAHFKFMDPCPMSVFEKAIGKSRSAP
jgi:PilZ domain